MTTSRQHQEAHGIGQVEDQLNRQAEAASEIQGQSEADKEITSASRRRKSELDEIIDL